jgi:hypothetical protein
MASPVKINFKMYQGSTFREVLRWESSTKVYAPITAISKSAPVTVTAPNHGCPVGWRARVVGAGGMKEINSQQDSYNLVTGASISEVIFNSINSLGYTAYTSGGVLEYNQPVPLGGYSARMQLRSKISSPEVLLELTTENGGIVIDTQLSTITIIAQPDQTTELSFDTAVYSLELITNQDVVPFCAGSIALVKEVTR